MPIPTYESKTKPPKVPPDEEIVEWIEKAMKTEPELVWSLGMLATYGLRPHEFDACRFIDDKDRLEVPLDTKTVNRIVIPVPKEWVEFDLRIEKRRKILPEPDSMSQWLQPTTKLLAFPIGTTPLGTSSLDVFGVSAALVLMFIRLHA